MTRKKIPTEAQIKRMEMLEEMKADYLKQFKNPVVKMIMNMVRYQKVEALVFLLVVSLTVIIVLTVSYNKTDGVSIKRIETKLNVDIKK